LCGRCLHARLRCGQAGFGLRLHGELTKRRALNYLFFSLPRTGTTVTMVGRTASGETVLGGDVSFLGFLTIFWDC